MTEKLKQTIKEEIAKLPKEAQDAINAFDWVGATEEIGKELLISEVEINDFQVQTLLVLIGLTNPDNYTKNIEDNVGTSKNEAEKIAKKANQEIFAPIASTLIENIKKSEESKNSNWEQTLNFILSGGDYTAFIQQKNDTTPVPTDTEKTSTSINKRRITDIKSKFTI